MKKLFLALTITIFAISAYAQTKIKGGEISGTWTRSGSPYQINGDIIISAGEKLKIEPGVTVQFQGFYKMVVQGSLLAAGTATDSIVFTKADTTGFFTEYRRGWNGIRFDKRPYISDSLGIHLAIYDVVSDTLVPLATYLQPDTSLLSYCKLEFGTAHGEDKPLCFGGAVYIYRYSNLEIAHCNLSNNRALAGGALYCKEASPYIHHTVFTGNSAESSAGAICLICANPVIEQCTITGNTSQHNGGGLFCYESKPLVSRNRIVNNTAVNCGGGVYTETNLDEYFRQLSQRETKANKQEVLIVFAEPLPDFKLSDELSEKLNRKNSQAFFTNNVVCNNQARKGGGMGMTADNADITNNTLSNNKAEQTGGALYCLAANPNVKNTILYGNKTEKKNSEIHLELNAQPRFEYCNVAGGKNAITTGESQTTQSFEYRNCISFDPQFKNSDSLNYELKETSFCIDAGQPDTSGLKLARADYKGKARVQNRRIDMGAYEFGTKELPADSIKKRETTMLPTAMSAPEMPDAALPLMSNNTQGNSASNSNLQTNTLLREMTMQVYPNPNNGQFDLTINQSAQTGLTVQILSLTGSSVYKETFSNIPVVFRHSVTLGATVKGLYLVQITGTDGDIIFMEKVVVE